jgi:hypothetical protein
MRLSMPGGDSLTVRIWRGDRTFSISFRMVG